MLRNKKYNKLIIAAVLVVGLALLAGTVPVVAADTTSAKPGSGLAIGRNGGGMADIVCDILGISRQDLATERRAGKSLTEVAAAHNVSQDKLTAAVMEKKQERLQEALKDNKITQEQYDNCLQNMKERTTKNLTRTTTGPNGNGYGKARNGARAQNPGTGNGNGPGICGNCRCR
ncbi:MAG: hypothetical protein ACOX2B_02840 [Syntrophothermaceae bacterium]